MAYFGLNSADSQRIRGLYAILRLTPILWRRMTAPQANADHFNAKGVTTRKGRPWTGATVAKFLSSPGAKRYRSGGKAGPR